MGIVDLFACEISTLCRVCTIVDLTTRYVRAFHADLGTARPPGASSIVHAKRELSDFEASEDYTPVFDQNAKDLQALNVKVVTNVTAFYTYVKAMKDAMRNLARINIPAAPGSDDDAWHNAATSVIY